MVSLKSSTSSAVLAGSDRAVLNTWTILFGITISVRIALTNIAPITDCDEPFNYWEPVHFLHFGNGLQTWEYANQYALRTYTYVLPLSLISRFCAVAMGVNSKVTIFRILRISVGATTALCECLFAKSMANAFGDFVGISTLFITGLCPGMFHCSPALLPSTSAMQLFMLSSWRLFQYQDHTGAIFFGLVATLCIGWPFSAALFAPTGFSALLLAWNTDQKDDKAVAIRKKEPTQSVRHRIRAILTVLGRTIFQTILIQALVFIVDYTYYGRLTWPCLNILMYNAASGGDELYGVEPISYYVKNILLNFNVIALLALVSIPLLIVSRRSTDDPNVSHKLVMIMTPLFLWLLLILPRPHKEERFLFPVYPLICLAGALGLDKIAQLVADLFVGCSNKQSPPNYSNRWMRCKFWTAAFILAPCALLSVSRSMALITYYTAPLNIYSTLHDVVLDSNSQRKILQYPAHESLKKMSVVCVAGEWYRFPSSYFLPSDALELGFLTSSFTGQLPQPFMPLGSAATSEELPQAFNDQNKEEKTRYVKGGISSCNFLIELMLESDPGGVGRGQPDGLEHMMNDGKQNGAQWEKIASFPFLDAERTGLLGRTLYLPGLLRKILSIDVIFAEYTLFQRK